MAMSFLGLEGYHVFITGAAGAIGREAAREFLSQGCTVTAHDLRPITSLTPSPNLFIVNGDISSETSTIVCMEKARNRYGPINVLIANAGIRGTFLSIKHFLMAVEEVQKATGHEIENIAIVVTGSDTGKFGQASHTEYSSGKSALQDGLVRGVKTEIVHLNSQARINAVAPGWVNTPLIEGRLHDPHELWTEAQATIPLDKIARPQDVAKAIAFLASHRTAGHINGECLNVEGGMEGRIIWAERDIKPESSTATAIVAKLESIISPYITQPSETSSKRKIQVLLSIDFDAVSGFLGTGAHENNNMADYSSGFFAGQVGVPRLLKLFKKHKISSNVTWFIPGHSMETFPTQTKMILDSDAEIACHGYAHEGGAQMTEQQEREVVEKCVKLATALTGKKPRGWRAPLYQLREHTVSVLEELGFLYDTSLTHHDSKPYFLPNAPAIKPIDFSPNLSASTWMKPLLAPEPPTAETLVELPCNWYMEDMTPMQFLPAAANSHGFVSANSIMDMWKARFDYLYHEFDDEQNQPGDFIFPLVLHPDTSGMAHVIGMIDRMIAWLKGRADVEFWRYEDVAKEWKARQTL